MKSNNKVLITGTGRCGTSAFIKFLSLVHGESKTCTNFQVPENATMWWNNEANAGMEYVIHKNSSREHLDNAPYIIKDTRLCYNLDGLLKKEMIFVDHLFVLIRDYRNSAKSRKENGLLILEGGGVRCIDERKSSLKNQIEFNQRVIGVLMETIARYDIPHTVIHFPTFVLNREYLRSKIKGTPIDCNDDVFIRSFEVFDEKKVNIK